MCVSVTRRRCYRSPSRHQLTMMMFDVDSTSSDSSAGGTSPPRPLITPHDACFLSHFLHSTSSTGLHTQYSPTTQTDNKARLLKLLWIRASIARHDAIIFNLFLRLEGCFSPRLSVYLSIRDLTQKLLHENVIGDHENCVCRQRRTD